MAGHAPGVTAPDDLREWLHGRADDDPPALPPLVWTAAAQVAPHVRLAADAACATLADGTTLPFAVVPRIPANRSYFDATSARFFAARPTRVRGELVAGTLVARTLWPEDFRFDLPGAGTPHEPPGPGTGAAEWGSEAEPVPGSGGGAGIAHEPSGAAARALLRSLVRGEPDGGARAPFAAWTLWQRDPAAPPPAGSAVLALVLSGAQGDDDEAHGGHFALATGRTRADGAIGDWLVNNFYSLDSESEKGILAAPLPLDNYLGDLNSGQNWYRPSYVLVAVLRQERAAALVQGALNRVYNQFYRHQLVYRHATMNCAGISIDVLRALGWPIPVRGPTNRLAGILGFPWLLATERSLARAKTAADYLIEDRTRLLPAIAFEDAGAGLLALARGEAVAPRPGAGAPPEPPARSAGAAEWGPAPEPGRGSGGGPLAQLLAADLDALAFLRLPQFPSSRAYGAAPVVSTREYRQRVPADPAARQIIPVPARPFPAALRDADLLPPPLAPSDRIARGWALALAFAVVVALLHRLA